MLSVERLAWYDIAVRVYANTADPICSSCCGRVFCLLRAFSGSRMTHIRPSATYAMSENVQRLRCLAGVYEEERGMRILAAAVSVQTTMAQAHLCQGRAAFSTLHLPS